MTLTAFARETGLTKSRMSQLCGEGLPRLPNGRIDPEAGRAWMAEWLDPKRREASKPGTGEASKGGQVAQIRAEHLKRDLRLKDLAVLKAEGSVVDRKEVEAAIFERARFERDAWNGWAARTAARLAAEVGADPEQMYAALDREVRGHLDDLASKPFKISTQG
ncbi:hypothetical protein A3731_37220 [Roseovarius sp. HI0049]|nr:hypothetical protein A3731_00705 [Roseovarius sp. HI0049]KZY40551.1 hypothetical protein A3731_37220 [Roseovarius sp. HI0049]